MYGIFGINTTRDILKLSQISKYHLWYLCQIPLQIILFPMQIAWLNFLNQDKWSITTQKQRQKRLEKRDSNMRLVLLLVRTNFTLWWFTCPAMVCILAFFNTDFFMYINYTWACLFLEVFVRTAQNILCQKNALDQIVLCAFHSFLVEISVEVRPNALVIGFPLQVIPLHEKFLQFHWLRAVVFQLNLKYLHVKITNLLQVVV